MQGTREAPGAAVERVADRIENAGVRPFLEALAAALERRRVRYCVLHDWEGLPERLASDLDMAVHPEDLPALGGAIREVGDLGYRMVQCLAYAPAAHYFVFFWPSERGPASARLDVITAHWRQGVRVDPAEAMVERTRDHRGFRAPEPAVEFRYLTAKRVLKGGAPAGKGKRVALLLRELGPAAAEEAVADLFGKDAARVVEAAAGNLDQRARALRSGLLWRNAWQRPHHLAWFWFKDAVRRVRRWLQPTGLVVAVMGPDGAGKSTFLDNLVRGAAPAFRRVRRYHWRPGVLGSLRAGGDTADPHGARADGKWLSAARLLWTALDYQLARLQLRWVTARSGLAVFDRYYYDILVDPRRYRYGGPLGLARVLARTVPKPDLLFVLHAAPETVAARKRELGQAELERQLAGYRSVAKRFGGLVIDASGNQEAVAAAGIRHVLGLLERRSQKRSPAWVREEGENGNG